MLERTCYIGSRGEIRPDGAALASALQTVGFKGSKAWTRAQVWPLGPRIPDEEFYGKSKVTVAALNNFVKGC